MIHFFEPKNTTFFYSGWYKKNPFLSSGQRKNVYVINKANKSLVSTLAPSSNGTSSRWLGAAFPSLPYGREGEPHFPVLSSFSKKKNIFNIPNIPSSYPEKVREEQEDSLVKLEKGDQHQHRHQHQPTSPTPVMEGLGVVSSKDKRKKTYYTSYSKLSEIKLLTIGIASPLRILQWAEKTLPNGKIYGEVLNANTLHHKTFKPQKGGLFCERIFGPLKDFECACGKVDKSVKKLKTNEISSYPLPLSGSGVGANISTQPLGTGSPEVKEGSKRSTEVAQMEARIPTRKYCPDCDVEYTWSVIRRYQLGYIKLSSPVTHIWFLKGTPSYLSLLLDMKKRYLQFVTYCSETLTIEKSSYPFYSNQNSILDTFSLPSFLNQTEKINETKLTQTSLFLPKENKLSNVGNKAGNQDILKSSISSTSSMAARSPSGKGPRSPFPEGERLAIEGHLGLPISPENQNSVSFKDSIYLKQKFYGLEKPSSKKDWSIYLSNKKKNERNERNERNEIKEIKDNLTLKSKISHEIEDFMSINNVQYMGKLLKNNTVKQGASILSSLLLSIYYKSFSYSLPTPTFSSLANSYPLPLSGSGVRKATLSSNVIQRDQSASLFAPFQKEKERGLGSDIASTQQIVKNQRPNLKKIFNKLPLDLYIICSLERILHKSSIILSIQKTWETLYKESFIKAINKAKLILTKSGLPPHIMLQTKPNVYGFDLPPSRARQESKTNVNANAYIKAKTKILNNIKRKYGYHILKSLQNLKYPILSINHTAQFSQKNSFIDLEKQSSIEIEKYFLKNTEHIQKSLTDLLLNFLVLDLFFNIYNAKNIALPISHLKNKVKSVDIEKRKQAFNHILNSYKNVIFEKVKNTSSFSYITPKGSPVVHSELTAIDASFGELATEWGSVLSLFPSSPFPTPEWAVRNESRSAFASTPFLFGEFGNLGEKMSREKNVKQGYFARGPRKVKNGNRTGNQTSLEKESNQKEKLYPNKNKDFKDFKDLKKKKRNIYHNVYTISHRERWDNDKDWQIFSLFSFGAKEYTDFPIYNYKNRLSSFLNSEDFSFFQADDTKYTIQENINPIGGLSVTFGKGQSTIEAHSFYSGAGIVQQLLNELDFYEIKKLDKQNRLLLYQLNKYILKLKKQVQFFVYNKTANLELRELCKKRDLLIRRTKLVRKLFRKNTEPASMILTVIPVLPPDLRPIVKMGNQIAASDLNRLYQRVIYRNDRLKKFLKDPATSKSFEMKYAQRLLQEAVDNLMQNGKSGPNSEKDARGRALKSLSDSLKGKQGRFRQFLLGKRVDYSGRSVIVVGPKLKLYECGIPVEIAKELYLPFLLKSILNKNYAKTVVGAKTLIRKNSSLANELLREIMQVSPLLLNRAPTLHRLGFQAFIPKLIEGRAILLHPLVCSAFNADFDGDQMAVHLPITVEARAEAWKMMLARNNILSPATGDPLAIPSQDMVLGCYYLTTYSNNGRTLKGSGLYFKTFHEVIKLYDQQLLDIHAFVWVKWVTGNADTSSDSFKFIENGNDQEDPFEIRISPFGHWQEITSNYQKIYDSNNTLISQYIRTTPGRILFNLMIQKITNQ